jgi:hypothetical protein
MTAHSFTDWAVRCDRPLCTEEAWASALVLRDGTAAHVREVLKRQGWAVAVPDPIAPVGRATRLDFCPKHKPQKD